MMMYDVQIDVKTRKLVPYTVPSSVQKKRKRVYETVNAF
jgi:hypothetical protein